MEPNPGQIYNDGFNDGFEEGAAKERAKLIEAIELYVYEAQPFKRENVIKLLADLRSRQE